MKKIKDYLPFYLGCEMLDIQSLPNRRELLTAEILQWALVSNNRFYKPILRPISDLQKEDQDFFGCPDEWFEYLKTMKHQILYFHTDEFHYLLSKHFDLFGLIEAGLAIDATTLKQVAQ